jgi:two-component system, chemotaxis family, CheB/CheR fusion protein
MKKQIKPKLPDPEIIPGTADFPVIAIGASAGGLEALEEFFKNMPADCGMAFVIIQHLDPTQKGMLPELLQRTTKMTVYTVKDRMRVKPDCLYVIPPNKTMSILNGLLHLFTPVESRGLRLPIDFFFRSLADDRLEKSIAVVLSGMGSDGSMGLRDIKEKGGLVLVQSPETARFDSMPRSAIEAVTADVVAPMNELPLKLIELAGQTSRPPAGKALERNTSVLEKIIILLRSQTGNDFSQYKKNTLYRRIERRMNIHKIESIATYLRYLQENPAETGILFKELLIGVTSFFRDVALWEQIKKKVIPQILAKASPGQIVRIWVPGCSTGEEAYSMAMVFREALENEKPKKDIVIQIFATDIDSNAIDKARKGIYPANISSEVSADRLKRYFTEYEDYFRIRTEIREMVVFAPQNVIKDPPFTRLDILCCRNLLIYLDANIQKKLLMLFYYSLNPNGFLILGSAETNGAQGELFSSVDSRLRIYRRSNGIKKPELSEMPGNISHVSPALNEKLSGKKIPDNIQTLTEQLLLQQYSPASILVTDKGDILYITGSTGKYLEPSAGKANMNLFSMAREGLRNKLPELFRSALQTTEKVILHKIKIDSDGVFNYADVTIQKIERPTALKGKILVIFNPLSNTEESARGLKKVKLTAPLKRSDSELEIKRLHEELNNLREEMQTSQEEISSANEELQSTNEELQSANEELTTSKEEMQSMNEELNTVNVELQNRIDDFSRVNNDMNNLLNSIEIATLFLDKELKIRQYTFPATKIFKLIPSDVGRLFTDQVTDLNYPDMISDARLVLRTLHFVEKEINTNDGRWYTVRIMPYRTFDDRIDGLVITFIDITNSKNLENALRSTQMTLNSIIKAVPEVILGLSSDGRIIEFNPKAEELFGCPKEEVMGKNYVDFFIPDAARSKVQNDMKNLLTGTFPHRYINTVKTGNGDLVDMEWSPHKLIDKDGTAIGIITVGVNVSKIKSKIDDQTH